MLCLTTYTTGLRDYPGGKDGRLSPDPELGDSGSCHLATYPREPRL